MKEKIVSLSVLFLGLLFHEVLSTDLVNFKNFGISFGLMANNGLIIILLNLILLIFLWINLKKELILIWVGGMGNLIDRLRWGYVRDYWNIFDWFYNNIFDWLIAIGLLLLIIKLWNTKKKK